MTRLSMTKMHGANLGYITLQGPDNASTGSNLTFSIAVRLSDFNLLSVPDRSHFSCILTLSRLKLMTRINLSSLSGHVFNPANNAHSKTASHKRVHHLMCSNIKLAVSFKQLLVVSPNGCGRVLLLNQNLNTIFLR